MDALPRRSSWRVAKGTRWPERPRTEGLLEESVDAIPVRVVIEQEGFVTGWDDGALGFDDEAVWFSGRACSFQVFALDLHVREHESLRVVETRLAVRLLRSIAEDGRIPRIDEPRPSSLNPPLLP